MSREPLWTVAGITGAVAAVIALLVSFGIDVSEDQTKSILGIVAVVAPLIVAYVTRPKVTPVSDPIAADGSRLVKSETLRGV